jgi:hypothetical protein
MENNILKTREENPLFILLGKFLGYMSEYESLPNELKKEKAVEILDRLLQDVHYSVSIAEKIVNKQL